MLVYVAGPYKARSERERRLNVERARDAAAWLVRAGFSPFCPHTMMGGWEEYRFLVEDDFMRVCLEHLEHCEALLALRGWKSSTGSRIEVEFAEAHGIPVFESLPDLIEEFSEEADDDDDVH